MRRSSQHHSAFTLAELMVGLGAAVSVVLALTLSAAPLQRNFYAMQDYADESIAEMRLVDYIGRDLRAASSVTISGGGSTVSLQVPNLYSSYDTAGNPTSAVVTPTFSSTGVPQYGDTTKPLVITYYVSGNQLIRQQLIQVTGHPDQTNFMVIASNVNAMQTSFTYIGTVYQYQVSFAPRYYYGSSTVRPGTVVKGTMSVRALRFQ